MRAIWTGSITFGMVTIPCKMYTATNAEAKIEFNQINAATGNRVRQKRVDEVTGEEVPYDQVIKGYEVAPGRYVTVTDEELMSVAPDKTSTIEILHFVEPSTIDPLFVDSPYLLGPDSIEKPYALLNAVLKRTGKVAIGRFVMRSKEHLCMLRPLADGLSISTLRWADEVRGTDELKTPKLDLNEREVQLAEALVESLSDPFDIGSFRDTYRESVMELIEAKASGMALPVYEAPTPAPAEDLMAALEASIQMAQKKKEAV